MRLLLYITNQSCLFQKAFLLFVFIKRDVQLSLDQDFILFCKIIKSFIVLKIFKGQGSTGLLPIKCSFSLKWEKNQELYQVL